MKHPLTFLVAICALLSGLFAHGNTLYVDLNSANPTPPYSDWSTAATNIQDAIDASADGDQIWVTNGVYQTGGKVMAGTLTNRVALYKAVTVQSVNGPLLTTIAGIGATNGPIAVRCAWLTNNAALIGFTLTQGGTRNNGDPFSLQTGGGVWCAASNAIVSRCMIVSNTSYFIGGGVYKGSLSACFITSNSVPNSIPGGAVDSAILNDCTVANNPTAGINNCKATNSIIYFNQGNYVSSSLSFSCTTPTAPGAGNFTNAPLFFPDHIHLIVGSPGLAAGGTPVTSTDIFGRAWGNPPALGCAEATTPLVSQPQVRPSSTPAGFIMTNFVISGAEPFTFNWLKDGTLLQDDGHFISTQNANLRSAGASFADVGDYQIVVSNAFGVSTSAVARVIIHAVDLANGNPVAPYSSWENAATNIQDAIDAASVGEIVLVTNGVYSTGGKVMSGDLTNRVAVDKALAVVSVNGYTSTVIEGQWDSATNGPGAIRCAWITNGAALCGFTLRNGATRGGNFITPDLQYGGGTWLCPNAVISNCVLTNNSAREGGGGIAFGTANNCFLGYNSTSHSGSGAYSCTLNNCTVRRNRCFDGSVYGGGVDSCVSRNCIIFNNYNSPYGSPISGNSEMNYPNLFLSSDSFTNCCTTPLPSRGINNTAADPLFLDFMDGFVLSPASPCRGAGNSLFVAGNDLDNEPFLNPPSIGCDEMFATNATGPLSFGFMYLATNTLANHRIFFVTTFEGRPSELDWSFGDGPTATNLGAYTSHNWTNAGTYMLTLTAYNADHPSGVSTNLTIVVDPLLAPTLQVAGVVSNKFQFSFNTQTDANYAVQYTTNLASPTWQTLQMFYFSKGVPLTVQDSTTTDGARFYRVQPQ